MHSYDLINQGALPQMTGDDGEWRYVRDEELGLSRFRVNGPNSGFTVEDLVQINDTVTIWIYHDPQEFYMKDDEPEEVVDGGTLQFSRKITNVIGSGSRQNQFFTDTPTLQTAVLGRLGLINKAVGEATAAEIGNDSDASGQVPSIKKDDIYDLMMNFVMEYGVFSESTTALGGGSAADNLRAAVAATFTGPKGRAHSEKISNSLEFLRKPSNYYEDPTILARFDETGIVSIEANEGVNARDLAGRRAFENVIKADSMPQSITENRVIDNLMYGLTYFKQEERDEFASVGLDTPEKINTVVVEGVNGFAIGIQEMLDGYIEEYKEKRNISINRQYYQNGRTVLLNSSHGETPYLALRGHISSVQTTVGTAPGTHIVTISGTGLEKPLKEHQIYFENLLIPSEIALTRLEFNAVYAGMSPSAAIQHMINRWLPKQVLFGKRTAFTVSAISRHINLPTLLSEEESPGPANSEEVKKFKKGEGFSEEKVPVRGNVLLSTLEDRTINAARIFTSLNYIDTTRIQEMSRALNASYDNPGLSARLRVPMFLESKKSVYDNVSRIAGANNLYEMFVDELGRVRYRFFLEAIERTPQPLHTPIIQDSDVLSQGASFSTDDSQLVTLVDVLPHAGANAPALTDLGYVGRSVPVVGSVPLTNLGEVPIQTVAPDLYRYGLRTLLIRDAYQSEIRGSQIKATLYRQFYGEPIKKASLSVPNNTSFRRGETVLVCLQRYKYRSKSLIDIDRTLDWLNYIKDNPELVDTYVGVDLRLTSQMKDSFALTSGEYSPIPGDSTPTKESPYGNFESNPKMFVLEQFIHTFRFIRSSLSNTKVITPEFFPNSYWFWRLKTGGPLLWDENRGGEDQDIDSVIMDMHRSVLRASIQGSVASANRLHKTMKDFPGIINNLKFQNFKATSYYIDSVSHNFTQDSAATTNLGLNFGQDNLVLLEPKLNLPIGFISIDRKLKTGYDNVTQNEMWQDKEAKLRSPEQNIQVEQFKEDMDFKAASFLHQSQAYRNSTNYMYTVAMRAGLFSGMSSGSTGRVEPEPATPVPTGTTRTTTNESSVNTLDYSDRKRNYLSRIARTSFEEFDAANTLFTMYELSVAGRGESPVYEDAIEFVSENK